MLLVQGGGGYSYTQSSLETRTYTPYIARDGVSTNWKYGFMDRGDYSYTGVYVNKITLDKNFNYEMTYAQMSYGGRVLSTSNIFYADHYFSFPSSFMTLWGVKLTDPLFGTFSTHFFTGVIMKELMSTYSPLYMKYLIDVDGGSTRPSYAPYAGQGTIISAKIREINYDINKSAPYFSTNISPVAAFATYRMGSDTNMGIITVYRNKEIYNGVTLSGDSHYIMLTKLFTIDEK
jgi:hypothetical protein